MIVFRAFILVSILLAAAVGALAQTQSSPAPALSAAEELELRTFQGQLADASRDQKTKQEAAKLLLSRSYPQATDALRELLADPSNRSAQIAIAEQIVRQNAVREGFVEPLMAMLLGNEPMVRAPATRALSIYRTPYVTTQLVTIAQDPRLDKQIRLVTITALENVLNRQAVDALVTLLDDADAAVRDAAAQALGRLTGIRTYGSDPEQWKSWWNRNKSKDHAVWLASLAENLARSKAELESQNVALRDRLSRSLMDLYESTPSAQREAVLASFLKDPLGDVRLVGLSLLDRRIMAGETISADTKAQVRGLLANSEPAVRQGAVRLMGTLGDVEVVAPLLDALRAEESPSVRAAMMTALGQLRDPQSLPAVLAEVESSSYDNVAAAGATALSRIASRQPLTPEQQAQAIATLMSRYQQLQKAVGSAVLREAILNALSSIGQKDALPVLLEALGHTDATVRQTAVNGLAKINDPASVSALVPLTSDADRGVRQAAVAAIGTLGGEKYLESILQRTDPTIEGDSTVRQQAWDVASAVLAKASEEKLLAVIASLTDRPDAESQRIKLMQMRVSSLRSAKSERLPSAQRELAAGLLKASRPGDAAAALAEAYAVSFAAGSADAPAIWNEWIDAMLSAGDVAVVKALAQQNDRQQFAAAYVRLAQSLATFQEQNNYALVLPLCDEAARQLGATLTPAQRQELGRVLEAARTAQSTADKLKVTKLLPQLTAGEEAVRKSASVELTALGERATEPLVQELRRNLVSELPSADAERAILSVLRQIAPQYGAYDPNAPVADRLKLIDGWLAQRS